MMDGSAEGIKNVVYLMIGKKTGRTVKNQKQHKAKRKKRNEKIPLMETRAAPVITRGSQRTTQTHTTHKNQMIEMK